MCHDKKVDRGVRSTNGCARNEIRCGFSSVDQKRDLLNPKTIKKKRRSRSELFKITDKNRSWPGEWSSCVFSINYPLFFCYILNKYDPQKMKEEKLSARHHSYTEHMVYMRERRNHNEQVNNASSQQERERDEDLYVYKKKHEQKQIRHVRGRRRKDISYFHTDIFS